MLFSGAGCDQGRRAFHQDQGIPCGKSATTQRCSCCCGRGTPGRSGRFGHRYIVFPSPSLLCFLIPSYVLISINFLCDVQLIAVIDRLIDWLNDWIYVYADFLFCTDDAALQDMLGGMDRNQLMQLLGMQGGGGGANILQGLGRAARAAEANNASATATPTTTPTSRTGGMPRQTARKSTAVNAPSNLATRVNLSDLRSVLGSITPGRSTDQVFLLYRFAMMFFHIFLLTLKFFFPPIFQSIDWLIWNAVLVFFQLCYPKKRHRWIGLRL